VNRWFLIAVRKIIRIRLGAFMESFVFHDHHRRCGSGGDGACPRVIDRGISAAR
jgi:hypothetical protein